jgi:hypothetical protein
MMSKLKRRIKGQPRQIAGESITSSVWPRLNFGLGFFRLFDGLRRQHSALMEIGGGGAVIVIATFHLPACRFSGIWPWPWSWLMGP